MGLQKLVILASSREDGDGTRWYSEELGSVPGVFHRRQPMGEELNLPNKGSIALPLFKFMGCWSLDSNCQSGSNGAAAPLLGKSGLGFPGRSRRNVLSCLLIWNSWLGPEPSC